MINRLSPAMAMKHGFSSVDEYKEKVQMKFSLLKTGIVDQPATRLLLINVGLPLTSRGMVPLVRLFFMLTRR